MVNKTIINQIRTSLYFSIFITIGVLVAVNSDSSNINLIRLATVVFVVSTLTIFALINLFEFLINQAEKRRIQKIKKIKNSYTNFEKIEFDYTLNDYYKSNLAYLLHQGKVWFIILFFSVGFIYFLFSILLVSSSLLNYVLILLCIYYMSYPFLGLYFRCKKFFKEQEQLQGKQEIYFTENEMVTRSTTSEEKIKRAYKILFTKNYLLIFNTPMTFTMIPRRIFNNQEDYDDVIRLGLKLLEKYLVLFSFSFYPQSQFQI